MPPEISNRVQRLWQVVVQSAKDFFVDDSPQWAAAIAYYSLLSAFPLLLAIASIAAYFVDPDWAVEQAARLLDAFLPAGAIEIEETITSAIDARGTVSLLSIGTLLWTGSRVFGAVTKALNIAFSAEEPYSFWKRTLVELLMLLSVGLLFVVALTSRYLIGLLWGQAQNTAENNSLFITTLRGILPAVLLLLSLFLIYRFVPRTKVDWRAALVGGALAAGGMLIARPIFITYINRFASYNLIYGSLAVVVIIVFWAWIMGLIFLFAGQITAHIHQIIIKGQTIEEVEQAHKERSPFRRLRPD
jgi:membrane protein